MNTKLLGGASAAVIAICAGSWAQDARAAEAAAAATAQQQTTVGELVVTAERRSQNLETVPVSVSAYSAAQRDLVGIKSVQDLTDYTPGLSYTSIDNRPYIRGIGRNTDNLAVETGVAVYVDGVYFGADGSTILQTDSLFTDQIEVLRGPQSTLYGRNADGGAINYISVHPPKEFKAEARAGYSNYDKKFGEAALGGPITPWLRFRIGGGYTDQTGGFFRNLNGPSEGGYVAQGGNGFSYHAEAQFAGEVGDHFEWWAKVATSDYKVTFHTGSLIGPYDQREFPNPLYPSPNFGLCMVPGGMLNPGCAPSLSSPDTIVPGSVVTLPNTSGVNPTATNVRSFDADFKSESSQNQNTIVAAAMTYHFPTFDVKYLFGYQRFLYALSAPYVNAAGVSSSVQSYVLQGPASPGILCLINFANAGCTQNLKVNTGKSLFTFVENEAFWSHELDFTSTNSGPIQWIGGLYWYHKHYNQPINNIDSEQDQVASPDYLDPNTFLLSAAPANPSRSVFNQDTILTEDSYAAFGQVDWKITNTIKLTGGVRYSNDRKFGSESHRLILFNAETVVPGVPLGVFMFGANTPAFDFTSCPATTFPGAGPCTIDPTTGLAVRQLKATWDAWTGTADVSWTPDPSTLAYAKYSRGYKTGGFNSGIIADFPETQPETVDAWEIGLKKTVGRMFQANLAGFYYNFYNDQQPFSAFSNGVTVTEIFNIPTVHTYGFELEAVWQPIRDLTFNLNYAYLHSTIASMVQPNGTLLCVLDTNDPFAIAPGANTNGCVAGSGGQNLTGQILPETPRNKISLNAIYKMNFEPGSLSLSGSFIWKDATYDSPFNRSYNLAPSYDQVNLRATWTDVKNRYSIIVFCDNVFNSLGYDGSTGLAVTDPGANQIVDNVLTYTAPRTYGVEVQVRWP